MVLACQEPATEKGHTFALSELTIADIHAAYAAGEYTSEDSVTAYFARMASLNGELNALTYRNPAALEVARRLDAEFARTGKLRPLHGIPLLVRDDINTTGMPTTAGPWRSEIACRTPSPPSSGSAMPTNRALCAGARRSSPNPVRPLKPLDGPTPSNRYPLDGVTPSNGVRAF